MQGAFDALCERIECILSAWWGASLAIGAAAAILLIWGRAEEDAYVWRASLLIVILLIGSGRRDTKALLAQNELIMRKLGITPPDHLESRPEAEIEATRKG